MFKQRRKTLLVWAISLSCMVSETNQQEKMMSSSRKYSQAKAAKAKAAKESIFGKIHFDGVLQQQHATSPEPYNSPGTRKIHQVRKPAQVVGKRYCKQGAF